MRPGPALRAALRRLPRWALPFWVLAMLLAGLGAWIGATGWVGIGVVAVPVVWGCIALWWRTDQELRAGGGRLELWRRGRRVVSAPAAGMRAYRTRMRRGRNLLSGYQMVDREGTTLLFVPADESWPVAELLALFGTAGIVVSDLAG